MPANTSNPKPMCTLLNLILKRIGSKKAVDMRIAVDADMPTLESHDLAHQVEDHICQRFNIVDTSIHVEPYLGKENKRSGGKNK